METEEPKKKEYDDLPKGKSNQSEALTSYYRKYYLANREKLLERSKQRYHTMKQTKEPKKEEPKAESSEDVFQIDDLGTPNKTTIEKIKELFNVVKTE
jgi:hypothetical protein